MGDVLVVDDEAAIREVLTRWLQPAGYTTRQAADAGEALAQMTLQPAGVVLCDVHMPGPDGVWLIGELRRRFPVTAIVLATGNSTIPAKVSMQWGVLAYVLKPFQRDALLSAVKIAMDWHDDTRLRGPRQEDTSDRVAEWLESIKLGH